ncbi:MAG TPA: inorganic diphosphatase [archaeon]|nr:inorganic diphosphatase [archaeon]
MTNAWHDVAIGKKSPKIVQAIIEIPKDSKLKYELDKDTGLMRLDRPLYSAVHYPGDYGFIPQTYWDDDDPMDILVLSIFSVYPNTIVEARPIALLEMYDGKEKDDKIIAVYASDPRMNNFKSLKDLPEHILLEVKHFFETYKELQNKKVKVLSFKDVGDAYECIERGQRLYGEKFGKK